MKCNRPIYSHHCLHGNLVNVEKGMRLNQIDKNIRISHRSCSETKGVLTNSTKFTGTQLCLRPVTLLKKRLWDSCFPVNFAKFLRTPFLQNTSGRLLLCHVPVDGMDILDNNAQAHSQSF